MIKQLIWSSSSDQLFNTSTLDVEFNLKIDSMNPEKQLNHEKHERGRCLCDLHHLISNLWSGTQNYNGSIVFDCFPCTGRIPPGSSTEISVIFNPDHESRCYRDLLHIVLFNSVSGSSRIWFDYIFKNLGISSHYKVERSSV